MCYLKSKFINMGLLKYFRPCDKNNHVSLNKHDCCNFHDCFVHRDMSQGHEPQSQGDGMVNTSSLGIDIKMGCMRKYS